MSSEYLVVCAIVKDNGPLSFRYYIVMDMCFLFQESIHGATLWKKRLNSAQWACLATWRTQKQCNLRILSTLTQRVSLDLHWMWSYVFGRKSVGLKMIYFLINHAVPYCFHLCSKKGHDMESLLFHFLDDWLFKFSADLFFVPRVSISYMI